MSLRARAALLVLLLVLLTAGPALGAVPPATSGTAAQESPPTAGSDETTFVIELEPNGDARWTVRMNYSIATDDRRDAFNSTAAAFESGADLRSLTAFRTASEQASAATGREMAITSIQYDSATYNNTGQLVLQFTWTNFSRLAGDRLHVDDVFNTTRGTWFQSLGPDQALVIVPPAGYTLADAPSSGYAVSSGSLRWDGEQTFAAGDLTVTYRDVGDAPGGLPLPGDIELIAAAVLLGGVLLAGVYLVRQRDVRVPLPTTNGEDPPGDGSDQPSDTGAAVATDGTDEDEIDTELLSDEERIERLLEQNGGRMKQANIVTETGWSNAKVSQLLSSMDDDDRIDKLRIGRENLISFPDENVADVDGDDP